METLSWRQVNRWRLAQHSLLERSERAAMLDVVSRLGGAHAQLLSAAELSLAARVRDLTPADVQRALWKERTLVKTWAMRGTLHLLAARDFPLYVAALSTLRHFRRPSWQKYHGVTWEELEALMEGAQRVLGGEGMTREALADALAEQVGEPRLRDLLLSGWGALLKPVAFQGRLCFGPNQGQNVTFVRPEAWLGPWEAIEPDEALREVARRFLVAYGPSTHEEFARWFGLEPSAARRLFRSLDPELVPVDVAGWQAVALASTLDELRRAEAERSVRLLPHFDAYTVALARQAEGLMPAGYKGRIYRPQGWIMPVVLVDGRMEGTWEQAAQREQTTVTVELFTPQPDEVRDAIGAEAERLAAFLGTGVEVVYATLGKT